MTAPHATVMKQVSPLMVVILLTVALLGGVAWYRAMTPRLFFSGDEGLKSVQRRAFSQGRSQLLDPAVGLISGVAGAAGTTKKAAVTRVSLTPWRPPFVQPCGGGLCSVWRNPVVRLGGWLERLGGPPLAALVSWLGLLAWLLAAASLARRLGAPPVQTVAALLLASPAWLYGVVFWEHAPAAAVATAALAWSLGRGALGRGGGVAGSPAASGGAGFGRQVGTLGVALGLGILVAMAVLSRPETALIALICGFFAVKRRSRGELVAVVIGGLVTLLLAIILGDGLLGWLRSNAGQADVVSAAGGGLWRSKGLQVAALFAGVRGGRGGLTMLAAGVVGAWVVSVVSARPWLPARFSRAALWLALAAVVIALLSLFEQPAAQAIGLLIVAPGALIGLAASLMREAGAAEVPGSDDSADTADAVDADRSVELRRQLAWACWLTLLLAVVTAPNDGGSQWGPRYLLPWLAPGLALALAAPGPWRSLVRAGLALGLVAQLLGMGLLAQQQADKAAAMRWLAASPAKVLIAQAWYTPQELAGLALDEGWQLGLADDLGRLDAALAGLERRKEAWWIFAADPRLPAARFLARRGRWQVVGSRDVAFPPVRVRLHLVRGPPERRQLPPRGP